MIKSPNWLSKILKEETVTSTNDRLAELCQEKEIKEFTTLMAEYQTAGKGQRGNSWESEYGKNLTFSTVFYPQTIAPASQFILSMAVASAIRTALAHYVHADCLQIKWPNDIYWKDKKIVGILIENDLTGSQISQSIVGIGININQEEFHSSAPNPVSLRQITQKETDRMEVLNSVLEHIINLYSRIENRETDIITKIQEYYLKAQSRKEGYHPYCDAKGEFTAKLIRVEPDGHLILKDKNGSLRKYTFKEVKYIL
ncbi:biotin--[acetyl-CoA-carboxylase] ligase [Bacteroides uniformis]|nr:biotin--[acetyl-CoA-carboxylase] ligase [Bacteroides uniformis]